MKIDGLFEGSLKIVKNSDEMAEYGQDKSKGDIHKTSMKKANSNWSESENQDIWKDLAETIKKEWLSLIADGKIGEEMRNLLLKSSLNLNKKNILKIWKNLWNLILNKYILCYSYRKNIKKKKIEKNFFIFLCVLEIDTEKKILLF